MPGGIKDTMKFQVPSDLKEVPQATERVFDFLKGLKISESDRFDIRLSFEEVLINGMKHGNRFNPELTVAVEAAYNGSGEVYLAVKDQGKGFDFSKIKDPTHGENLKAYNGRGVYLAKHLMDRFAYAGAGNHVEMVKVVS